MLGQVQAWSSKAEDLIEAYTQVSAEGWDWGIERGSVGWKADGSLSALTSPPWRDF